MVENVLIQKIKEVVDLLDEIDSYIEELPNKQSEVDSLLSDYRHFLKENEFTKEQAYEIALKIKESELIRSQIKEDLEISRLYNELKSRLPSKENRKFLTNKIFQRTKEWGQPYKYRVLTQEEVDSLLNVTSKKKRGRPKKEDKVEKKC